MCLFFISSKLNDVAKRSSLKTDHMSITYENNSKKKNKNKTKKEPTQQPHQQQPQHQNRKKQTKTQNTRLIKEAVNDARVGAATCQCVGISQPTDTILLEWWYRCHSALAAVSKLRQSSARVFHFLSFKFYNFARNKIGKQYFFLQISHFGWQLLRYDFRLSISARNSLVSFREKLRYSS